MAGNTAAAPASALTSCSCSSRRSSTGLQGLKRPQSNGIAERFHRTLPDEHFRVEGQRTWFETIGEMQAVLDDYLTGYNTKRPHQGRGMNGRTPRAAFIAGLPKPQPKQKEKAELRKPDKQRAA